jgi:hypothetical protein
MPLLHPSPASAGDHESISIQARDTKESPLLREWPESHAEIPIALT